MERRLAYRQPFKHHLSESGIAEIRETTHKDWMFLNDRFMQRVQKNPGRRVEPVAKGGDR